MWTRTLLVQLALVVHENQAKGLIIGKIGNSRCIDSSIIVLDDMMLYKHYNLERKTIEPYDLERQRNYLNHDIYVTFSLIVTTNPSLHAKLFSNAVLVLP